MTTTPPAEAVRARIGTLLIFLVNGMTFASLVPRYPQIKASLDVSQTMWGLAVGLGPLGGLALGLAAARLMRRFGSRNVAIWPQLAGTLCLVIVAWAPHIAWVFVAMILMSALDAVTDTAMNFQALRVQRLYRRSIINTFHGWWSIGAVLGGLIGSAMAQWRVDIIGQAVATVGALALVCWFGWSLMLPGKDAGVMVSGLDAESGGTTSGPGSLPSSEPVGTGPSTATSAARSAAPSRVPRRIWAKVIALGVVGAIAGGVEAGGSTWAPLYMDAAFVTTPFIAGMAFVGLMVAETVGRLVGDGLVDRFGQAVTIGQGAAVCLVGMTVSIAWPTPVTAILGFTAAGWGIATTIPLAMGVANSLPGVTGGIGLTVTTWVMRLGFMAFPVGIGALGDAVSLRWAMICLPAGALVILILAPLFRVTRVGSGPGREEDSRVVTE